MTFAMVLDILVVVLLVPTIIYAVILNSRLSVLRKNREELGRMISTFNEATVRAESGIPRLKRTYEESAKGLQEKVERAQVLRDDLAYMIERADEMSARLDRTLRDARHEAPLDQRPANRAGVSPLPRVMDIESAAAAAEEAERAALASEREAAERIANELAAAARNGEQALPADRPMPSERPVNRSAPVTRPRRTENFDAGPENGAENALAERILKDHAAMTGRGERTAGDRATPDRGAMRGHEAGRLVTDGDDRRSLSRRTEDGVLDERSEGRAIERGRSSGQTREGTRATRSPRSGQLLSAALAEETRRVAGATASRPASSDSGAPMRDEDERSEAERELLKALRSAR